MACAWFGIVLTWSRDRRQFCADHCRELAFASIHFEGQVWRKLWTLPHSLEPHLQVKMDKRLCTVDLLVQLTIVNAHSRLTRHFWYKHCWRHPRTTAFFNDAFFQHFLDHLLHMCTVVGWSMTWLYPYWRSRCENVVIRHRNRTRSCLEQVFDFLMVTS